MEWCKLFASLPDDPRVQAADDAELGSLGLLVQSFCYCTSAESDGFIPTTQVPRFGGAKLKARTAALVREGLWIEVPNGYMLDPDLWNEDKNLSDQAEKKRAADRDRIAAKRAAAKATQNGHVPVTLSRDLSHDCRATGSATRSGDSRSAEKRREELPPPSPPAVPRLTLVPGEASPGEGEDFDQERNTLIAEIRCIRPDWSTRSIRSVLKSEPVAERPWRLVRTAALKVARDPESKYPGRLACDGDWWIDDAPAVPKLPPLPAEQLHPYSPDGGGTCHCGLPETNRRHEESA